MCEVKFQYGDITFSVNCQLGTSMKDICNKFISSNNIEKGVFFLYSGRPVNYELTFNQQANPDDRERRKMNILVDNIEQTTIINKNNKIKSKYVICPKCQEHCRIEIKDYKIKLYECKNNHKNNELSLEQYIDSQNINESKIVCNKCNKCTKNKTINRTFYICLTCNINLCPLCYSNHNQKNKEHIIIDYDEKYYYCFAHKRQFISYCNKCKINLCQECELEHKNHKILNYKNIKSPEDYELDKELNEFKDKVDKLKNILKKILDEVSEYIDKFYKIYDDMVKNYYNAKNVNYQIIQNINEIQNKLKINEIDSIIKDSNINNQFKNIFLLYNKLKNNNIENIFEKTDEKSENTININENINIGKIIEEKNKIDESNNITLIYKIKEKETKIHIFGKMFVKNNKKECKFLCEGKLYDLNEYFDLSNYDKTKDILLIKLIGVNNIKNMTEMFYQCSSLLCFLEVNKWNTSKVYDMSFMFYNCISLVLLPNISNWNISNVKDMSYMFYNCKSLSSLPDISKWDVSKVKDMSWMFYKCKLLKSLPDLSKWDIKGKRDMTNIFGECKSLSLSTNILEWNNRNDFYHKIRSNKICKNKRVSGNSSIEVVPLNSMDEIRNICNTIKNTENQLNLTGRKEF